MDKHQYIISPAAKKSLQKNRNYTLQNYGKKQAVVYLKMLNDHMKEIAGNPRITGIERNEIKAGYYSVFAGKHTIYYRLQSKHVEIIDILHQNMYPLKHL